MNCFVFWTLTKEEKAQATRLRASSFIPHAINALGIGFFYAFMATWPHFYDSAPPYFGMPLSCRCYGGLPLSCLLLSS